MHPKYVYYIYVLYTNISTLYMLHLHVPYTQKAQPQVETFDTQILPCEYFVP